MIKLALLDRAGADPQPLLLAQQMQLAPIAAALEDRVRATAGFEHTLAVWRHEATGATMRFLTAMTPWTNGPLSNVSQDVQSRQMLEQTPAPSCLANPDIRVIIRMLGGVDVAA